MNSLPQNIDTICCLCMIDIEELNSKISGIAHFRQGRLKNDTNNITKFPKFDDNTISIVRIKMTTKTIYYNDN